MYSFMRCCTWSNSRQDAGYSVLSRSKTQVSISPSGQRSCRVMYAIAAYLGSAPADQGTGAFGEQLEQDGVRYPSVEDDCPLSSAVDGVEAGLDLRDHATRDRPIGDQPARFGGGQLRYQALVGVKHARHVGQQQKPLRVHRGGNRAGDGVGIDVVGLAVVADPNRRDDRNDVGLAQRRKDADIDPRGLADKTEIAVAGQLARPDQPAILAGEADCGAPGGID